MRFYEEKICNDVVPAQNIGSTAKGIDMSLEELRSILIKRPGNYIPALGILNWCYYIVNIPADDRYHLATGYDIGYYATRRGCLEIPTIIGVSKYFKDHNLQLSIDEYLYTNYPCAFLGMSANRPNELFIWHRNLILAFIRSNIRFCQRQYMLATTTETKEEYQRKLSEYFKEYSKEYAREFGNTGEGTLRMDYGLRMNYGEIEEDIEILREVLR